MLQAQEILKVLPSLTPENRALIARTIKALDAVEPVEALDRKYDWLLNGIFFELDRRNLVNVRPSMVHLKKLPGYKTFPDKADAVIKLMERQLPMMTDLNWRQLGLTCASSLARYLEHKVALSLNIMINNVDKIPVAINASFPRYMEAGLLHLIVRA